MASASNRKLLLVRSVLALVLAGIGLSACGAKAEGPQKLKVSIISYISFSPFFIAEDEGYFAEQNLDVEFQSFDNSTLVMPLLEKGDLDAAGDVPVAGLFNAINQTGNMKIVADRGYLPASSCNYFAVLASSEWVSAHPNPTAEDIRGLKFSADPNSIQAFFLDKLLENYGLTLDDVSIQNVPPPNLIQAAKSHSVDFIVTAEPWVTRVSDTQKMVVWKGFQEVMPDAQTGFLNFGRFLSKDHPDIGKRFAIAYLKAVRQYNQGKTARNLEIISKYTKLDSALLNRLCWPSMRNDGSVDLSTVIAYQEWAVAQGQLDKVAGEDLIWDPQFIDAANAELGTPVP